MNFYIYFGLTIYIYEASIAVAVSSVYFPLSLPRAASLPLALRSRIDFRSLFIFNFTITHWNKTHKLNFISIDLTKYI